MIKRRYPNHVDTADRYGYVDDCPNQIDVSTYGQPLRRLYICGCPYDTWPVSLVKTPKLNLNRVVGYALLSCCGMADVGLGECDCPATIPPNPHPWRDRWHQFRRWLAAKAAPELYDDDDDDDGW